MTKVHQKNELRKQEEAAAYFQRIREAEYLPFSDHINYSDYPTKEQAWQWYEEHYSQACYNNRFDNLETK